MSNHDDKYNDPRATITRRGILIGVVVAVLAILGAYLSVTQRRTRLEETRAFWGDDTITALQLGERLQIYLLDGEKIDEEINEAPAGQSDENTDTQSGTDGKLKAIELTAMPGLGLLRRLLLDSRSYDWTTSANKPVESRRGLGDTAPQRLRLRISDPTANRFEPIELDLDLSTGWIGDSSQTKSVRINERNEPKLRNFFNTVIHAEQKRYDFRE